MSCNGCRVLRKGCSESCILRPCLQWIDTPESQGHATLFVAKFFGRADLMSFISAVPLPQRPALFQSLLFEACGRTINPVNGAVGLLATGNWQVCQTAVQTVLSGGVPQPIPPQMLASFLSPIHVESKTINPSDHSVVSHQNHRRYHQPTTTAACAKRLREDVFSFESIVFDTSCGSGVGEVGQNQNQKLLNLFV